MPFIKQQDNDFKLENNQLILGNDYLKNNINKFKKITGSRFAAILNKSSYVSEVKVWTIITNLYKEEMDQTLSSVGNIIEPKIKQYVIKLTNQNYLSYDPSKIGWDVFKDNKIFGGIPDAEPIDNNNNLCYVNAPMLEIKTTSIDSFIYQEINGTFFMKKDKNDIPLVKEVNKKYESWFDKDNNIIISQEYLYQLGLYLHLRSVDKGLYAIAFLKKEDYADPKNFIPEEHDIKLVELNVDLNLFKQYIDYATDWYNKYVIKGVSPQLSASDKRWLMKEKIQ